MHRYCHLFSTLKAFRNTHGHLWTLLRLSHGENRGSSPLGSANDFRHLAPKRSLTWPASPTFLQRTVLQTIGSRSRCDCRLEEAGSDLRHRRAGIGAKPASVLKMPTLRIAALPRGANSTCERAVQPSLM